MANQTNYRTNIAATGAEYTRFSVSRIVQSPSDNLIDMEVPVNFPIDLPNAYIEMALYSLADNSLVYYDVFNNGEVGTITQKTIQYQDGSQRNFVLIDFTKLRFLTLPIGTFSMTLSFTVSELGTFGSRTLKVNKISPSRTEVELELLDQTQKTKMINLVTPKITNTWIDSVLKQIFNQPITGVLPPTSPVKIDSGSIQAVLGEQVTARIATYGFDEDVEGRPGVYTVVQTVLDTAYPIAVTKVSEYLLEGNTFVDKDILLTIINEALNEAFDEVYYDTQTNPEKYRYNIV